jgi:hypothetical protein
MIRVIVDHPSPEEIRLGLKRFFEGGGDRLLNRRMLAWQKYRGVESVLKEEVDEYFPPGVMRELRLPVCVQNPARKIINSRFISYRLPPKRSGDERLSEVEHGVDAAQRQLELSTGVLGGDALLIKWDSEEGRFVYFVLQKFVPIYLPGNLEPMGVAYPLHSPDKLKDSECRWAVWTDQLSFYLEPNASRISPNDDGTDVNPWGVMPVLFAYREDDESEILADVLNAQALYNYTMTYSAHAGLLQGMGIPWKAGMPPQPGEPEYVSPYKVVYADSGQFGFATTNIDLQKLPDLAREFLNGAAFTHHLHLNWTGESMATSGEHERIREADLSIAVQGDNLRWAEFEKNRVKVERIIAERVGKSVDTESFSINFRESHLPMSQTEIFDLWKKEYDAGNASRADYFMAKDPDLTKEDAEQMVLDLDQSRLKIGDDKEPEPPRTSLLQAALAGGNA